MDTDTLKLGKTDSKLCSFNLSKNIQTLQNQVASTSSTQLFSPIQQKTFESTFFNFFKCFIIFFNLNNYS